MSDTKYRSPIGCTTEDPSPASFNAWCKKHKVLWPKCQTGVSATTGRCVLAQKDIQQGEVVVEIPDDVVLMAENCSIQDLLEADGLLKPASDALLEVQGLIIAVMHEKALGTSSRWAPYVSYLPQDMGHMITYWTESELSELEGTAAHDKLVGRVQHPADAPTRVAQLFEELVVPFVLSHDSVACVMLGGKAWRELPAEDISKKLWPLYQWSTAAVASYSFVLGDDHYQGMVAVWDLLNHVTGAVNVKLHHDADKGVLQMIATEDIPQGAEVINCYGQLSNAELLRGYGYVERHNSLKHVQVPAHFLIKAAAGARTASEGSSAHKQQQGLSSAAAGADANPATAAADESESEGESGSGSGKASGKSQSEEAEDSGSPEGDDDGDDSSSKGDDSSGSEDDSSSDSEDTEPDWDLEDDDEECLQQQQERRQQQQQQDGSAPAAAIPSLADAQSQIGDWEERWQLCFSLGLLPKNGVFQMAAGGLQGLPEPLLAVLLLLLADVTDCVALSAVAASVTAEAEETAATAAAVAAAASDATADDEGHDHDVSKASKKGRKRQAAQEQQQQQKKKMKHQQKDNLQQPKQKKRCKGGDGDAAAPAEAAAVADGANGADGTGNQAANVTGLNLGDVKDKLAALQFISTERQPAVLLQSALQLLVALMQSRYSCSLDADAALLARLDELTPRLAAAVMARSAEKEVWQQLVKALQAPAAGQQLMQSARHALAAALLKLAQEAAAAAVAPPAHKHHDCCGMAKCHHQTGHQHAEGEECQAAGDAQGRRSKRGSRRKAAAAGGAADGAGEPKAGSKGGKAARGQLAGPAAAKEGAGGASGGFTFNFQL